MDANKFYLDRIVHELATEQDTYLWIKLIQRQYKKLFVFFISS